MVDRRSDKQPERDEPTTSSGEASSSHSARDTALVGMGINPRNWEEGSSSRSEEGNFKQEIQETLVKSKITDRESVFQRYVHSVVEEINQNQRYVRSVAKEINQKMKQRMEDLGNRTQLEGQDMEQKRQ